MTNVYDIKTGMEIYIPQDSSQLRMPWVDSHNKRARKDQILYNTMISNFCDALILNNRD